MTTFTLIIDCDTPAFEARPHRELARILTEVADDVRKMPNVLGMSFNVRDQDGDKVGHFTLA